MESDDPTFFTEDLVAPPRHRAEALALFHDLYAALAEGARRYFDSATSMR